MDLLGSDVDVRGLAHVTGDGLLNLRRLNDTIGFEIDEPLPVQAVFGLIARLGSVPDTEMYEVFNMGTGFVCVTPVGDADRALEALRRHHPGAARIGHVTDDAGTVTLPRAGLAGDQGGFRSV